MLLVGDIGGTHARLRLLSPAGRVVRQDALPSRRYPSFDAALAEFLGKPAPKIAAAAFGVAGPVVNARVVATNLPWVIDARVLSRKLCIPRVSLLNDLVALSLGALTVPPSKLKVLGGAGAPKKKGGANVAVIAAGTGLGEALLVWDGERFVPSATEGGHTGSRPATKCRSTSGGSCGTASGMSAGSAFFLAMAWVTSTISSAPPRGYRRPRRT